VSESTPEPAPLLTVDCWLVDVRGLSDRQYAAWNAAEDAQRVRAASLAVSALRALTGGAVEACAYVVRPCSVASRDATYRVFPVAGAGAPGWSPRLDSGTWINVRCGCGGGDCGHRLSSIRLPGATQVAQVTIDGTPLDPSVYRLDGDRLYRLDGGVWPRTQNLALPLDAADTFAVTYYGRRPGPNGERAAGVLAVEFLRDLTGVSCSLPATVTQVVRNNVSMTLTPGVFPGGLTGLREVDGWTASVNPYRLTEPSSVLSPDVPRLHSAGTGPDVSWTPPEDTGLGSVPRVLPLLLTEDFDFRSNVLTEDESAWPDGSVVTLVITRTGGTTTWTATIVGAEARFDIDKADVNTLIALTPTRYRLGYVNGSVDDALTIGPVQVTRV
jgi:hypothetical protein